MKSHLFSAPIIPTLVSNRPLVFAPIVGDQLDNGAYVGMKSDQVQKFQLNLIFREEIRIHVMTTSFEFRREMGKKWIINLKFFGVNFRFLRLNEEMEICKMKIFALNLGLGKEKRKWCTGILRFASPVWSLGC